MVPICSPLSTDLEAFAASLESNVWIPSEVLFISYQTVLSASLYCFLNRLSSVGVRVIWRETNERGIFRAQNVGGSLSTDKWVLFLGIDDRFWDVGPEIVLRLKECLDTISADIVIIPHVTGDIIKRSRMSILSFFVDTLHQQGTLYSSTIFDDGGYFPASLGLYLSFQTTLNVALSRLGYTSISLTPLVSYGLTGATNQKKVFLVDRLVDYYCIYKRSINPAAIPPLLIVSFMITLVQQIRSISRR